MSKSQLWKLAFPQWADSTKTLQELLISGELQEDAYFSWASETYQLPFLAEDFFHQAATLDLLLRYPSAHWNSACFPVNEWEGTLYVSCQEPPEFKIEAPHTLVLGAPKAMNQLWQKMERPGAGASAVVEDNYEATIITGDVPSSPQEDQNLTNINFDNLLGDLSQEVAAAPESKPQEPVTRNLELSQADVLKLDFSNLDPLAGTQDSGVEKEEVTQAPPAIHTQKENSSEGVRLSPQFEETQFNFREEVTNVLNVPPPMSADSNSFTTTKTILPFDKTSQFTFTRTVYTPHLILEANSQIETNQDPQNALLSAFRILQDYYKKLMWVVRDQKGFAYPIACNNDWNFTESAWDTAVHFKHHNPFRIAKMTQKPYHGPVYSSPATDEFFKNWNGGKLPNQMTIVPIMMYGKVFGYLVGADKGPQFHKFHSLDKMEMVSKQLLHTFINIHKNMNQAA